VEDGDFDARATGFEIKAAFELADLRDEDLTGFRGGLEGMDIRVSSGGDVGAGGAYPAEVPVFAFTVERLRESESDRFGFGFFAREDPGVMQSVVRERSFQKIADQRLGGEVAPRHPESEKGKTRNEKREVSVVLNGRLASSPSKARRQETSLKEGTAILKGNLRD